MRPDPDRPGSRPGPEFQNPAKTGIPKCPDPDRPGWEGSPEMQIPDRTGTPKCPDPARTGWGGSPEMRNPDRTGSRKCPGGCPRRPVWPQISESHLGPGGPGLENHVFRQQTGSGATGFSQTGIQIRQATRTRDLLSHPSVARPRRGGGCREEQLTAAAPRLGMRLHHGRTRDRPMLQ